MTAPASAAELLAARARALARPAAADDGADADALPVLVFQVGEERLAMPLAPIVAIARVGNLVPLPRAVRPVYGVSAWRGRPLTVLSLLPGRPAVGVETRLLVLGSGARAVLAVVVDAVDEVRDLSRGELSPAGLGPRRPYALGVTPDGLLVLDGETLLHPDALIA
jgi:chemotaxis signal transduction protein